MDATTKTQGPQDAAMTNGRAGHAAPALASLKPAQLWHSSAPNGLRSAWKESPRSDGWKRLCKLLAEKQPPKTLRPSGGESPLAWGTTPAHNPLSPPAKGGGSQAALAAWIEAADQGRTDASFVLGTLAWAYSLAGSAADLGYDDWWRLLERLYDIASHAVDASLGEDPAPDAAFAQQALGGELPLVLSRLLPEMQPLRRLRKSAASSLTEGLLSLTDGEGMPTAHVLGTLTLLLTSWTRCRVWSAESEKPCWSADAETQYEWLVRQAVRLARPDGTLALCPRDARGVKKLLDRALALGGDISDNAAAAQRLGGKAYAKAAAKHDPPEPSVNSEWSSLSVLASDWPGKTHRATVSYAGRESRIEYAAGGEPLLSGLWLTEVKVDGRLLAPVDDWDEQCWFSDDDCDYLELNLDLEQGARLQRQILVAREDRVAFLSDIVLTGSDKPREISLATRLPLGEGVGLTAEGETRDGWLTIGDKRLAGLAPAALPEWRTDPRVGELTQQDGALLLTHHATGLNACSPLFLDAAPGRFAKQRTWRQLTVAQALERVGPDVAAAYRFQSGKDQWISYRSLARQANRTFIGHNVASECLFGRFLPTGEVDEFFEIEDD